MKSLSVRRVAPPIVRLTTIAPGAYRIYLDWETPMDPIIPADFTKLVIRLGGNVVVPDGSGWTDADTCYVLETGAGLGITTASAELLEETPTLRTMSGLLVDPFGPISC